MYCERRGCSRHLCRSKSRCSSQTESLLPPVEAHHPAIANTTRHRIPSLVSLSQSGCTQLCTAGCTGTIPGCTRLQTLKDSSLRDTYRAPGVAAGGACGAGLEGEIVGGGPCPLQLIVRRAGSEKESCVECAPNLASLARLQPVPGVDAPAHTVERLSHLTEGCVKAFQGARGQEHR